MKKRVIKVQEQQVKSAVDDLVTDLEKNGKIVPEEKLTQLEINQLREAKTKALFATTNAEKTYAQAQVAELEVKNIILAICNKYKLDVSNGDNVKEDGTIIRVKHE